jgi:hypothetical protein
MLHPLRSKASPWKVQESLFAKISAFAPDRQTGRDAESIKNGFDDKKMGDKKFDGSRGRRPRTPLVISSFFLSDHFFVLFFLPVWLGRGRHSIRKAVTLPVLVQPIFRIIPDGTFKEIHPGHGGRTGDLSPNLGDEPPSGRFSDADPDHGRSPAGAA